MPVQIYVRRGEGGGEVPPDTSHETGAALDLARRVYRAYHQQSLTYALVANLRRPSADMVVITRNGIGVVELKHHAGPITSNSQGGWFADMGAPIHAGSARRVRLNPHEQVQEYAEDIRGLISRTLDSAWPLTERTVWQEYRTQTAVCFTNPAAQLDPATQTALAKTPPRNKRWERFEIITPAGFAEWALQLRFEINKPGTFAAYTLAPNQILSIATQVLGGTLWHEIDNLLPTGKALASLALEQDGQRYFLPLDRDDNLVGRDINRCNVHIPDLPRYNRVSSVHARISYRADGHFYLKDEQSRNGTFVNGAALRGTQRLNEGDRVQLGDPTSEGSCEMRFVRDTTQIPLKPTV